LRKRAVVRFPDERVLSETAGAFGFGRLLNSLHRRVETDWAVRFGALATGSNLGTFRGGGAASEGRAENVVRSR